MFNSPIIDVAVVLCFTYFTLSLIVSGVNEFYASLIRKRGDFLQNAIKNLFFDTHWQALAEKLYQSENFKALKGKQDSLPSYIPASSFALALIEQFKGGDFSVIDMTKIKEVLLDSDKALSTGIEGAVRKVLLNFYERANGDLMAFQKQIEAFYNDAMDRLTGDYKRHTQKYIFAFAFLIAAALNADTLNMAKTMWANPSGLKQTADNLGGAVKEINAKGGINNKTIDFDKENSTITVTTDTTSKDSLKGDSVFHHINSTVIYLKKAGVPIGWTKENMPDVAKQVKWLDGFLPWLAKLGGVLITAFALMLGAPFWFDLLNKIINLRGTGKKPEEDSDAQAKKA